MSISGGRGSQEEGDFFRRHHVSLAAYSLGEEYDKFFNYGPRSTIHLSSIGAVARISPGCNAGASPLPRPAHQGYSEHQLPISAIRSVDASVTERVYYPNNSFDVSFFSNLYNRQGLPNETADSSKAMKKRLKEKREDQRNGASPLPLCFSPSEGNRCCGNAMEPSILEQHYYNSPYSEGLNGQGLGIGGAHEQWAIGGFSGGGGGGGGGGAFFDGGGTGRGIAGGGVAGGEITCVSEEWFGRGVGNELVTTGPSTSACGVASAAAMYGGSAPQGDCASTRTEEEAGPVYNDPMWSQAVVGTARDLNQMAAGSDMEPGCGMAPGCGLAPSVDPRYRQVLDICGDGTVSDGIAQPFVKDYEASSDFVGIAPIGQFVKAAPLVNSGGGNAIHHVPTGNLPLPPPMLNERAYSTQSVHDQNGPYCGNEPIKMSHSALPDCYSQDGQVSCDIVSMLPQDGEVEFLNSPGTVARMLREISDDCQVNRSPSGDDPQDSAGWLEHPSPTCVENEEYFAGSAADLIKEPINVRASSGVSLQQSRVDARNVSQDMNILAEPNQEVSRNTNDVVGESLDLISAMNPNKRPQRVPLEKATPSPGFSPAASSSYNPDTNQTNDGDSTGFSSTIVSLDIASIPSMSYSLDQSGDLYLESPTRSSVSTPYSAWAPDSSSMMDTSSPSVASGVSTPATNSMNKCSRGILRIFQETSGASSEHCVWDLSISRQIWERHRDKAKAAVPFLRKCCLAWRDCLDRHQKPSSLGVISSRCAKLCDMSFDVERMAISIQVPRNCIPLQDWLLAHPLSSESAPLDRQLVLQQILHLLATIHGLGARDKLSLWGAFTVWVSGGDDQVYVKPEFEDILKKMKEEAAQNRPSDPRCEDVKAFHNIFTLAFRNFMETHLLSQHLRDLLEEVNKMMKKGRASQIAEVARVLGGRRICQLRVDVCGRWGFLFCMEKESLQKVLGYFKPQLVRGDSEDWQVHYSSSSKLVAKDDLAVADCCIFLKIERIISTGIGTGSRYMFQ